MKREEQIIETAKEYYNPKCGPYSLQMRIGFIEGAKWADEHPNLSEEEQVGMGGLGMIWQKKTLIKKACEYLKTHLWQNVDADNDPIVESVNNITIDNFINDFEKYLYE